MSVALALRHGIVVKQAGGRIDDDKSTLDVDGRNEGRYEGNHNSALIRGNEKQILSRGRSQTTDATENIGYQASSSG